MGQGNDLLTFGNVLFDVVMGTIEHYGGETDLDAGLGAFISTMIQMQGYRNGNAQRLVHSCYHSGNRRETGHIFAGAFGNAKDNRRIVVLSGFQDLFSPLKVVNVELTDCVMACFGLFQHFGCGY